MERNFIIRFPLMAFVLLLASAGDATEKPNVLLIVVDDLGYGDLGSYGGRDIESPNIDALVSQGMKFTSAYANCPVCSPTRASILTGRYPELVGVPGVIRTHKQDSWGYLAENAIVLPSLLKESGYHTAAIGKWHLGLEKPNIPIARGFDLFHGFLGDMMDDYYNHRRHGNNYMRRNEKEIDPKGHATDLFSQWACEYLEERAGRKEPFFLYLAYNAPHTPIQPPADWLAIVKSRNNVLDDKRARLVALIEHMDAGIGRVLRKLDEVKMSKRTIVIFVSDNGGQLGVGANNSSLRDGKQSMYEGGLRVPMCAAWPGKIDPGSETAARVLSMDIFPTICELTGTKIGHQIDGESFFPILTGKKTRMTERDLFFHRREGNNRYGGMITNALIRGDWKLVRNSPFAPIELFNLKDDPSEKSDQSRRRVAKFNELSAALRAHIQRGGAVPWQPPELANPSTRPSR